MNYKRAPQIYHNAGKGNGNFYKLPQNIMDIVLTQLDGKNGNAIKLMIVLLGTSGDGSFRASEKWIEKKTGMKKQNYHRAKNALAEKGMIILEDGKIIVNIKGILESHRDDDLTENMSHRDDNESHHQNINSHHDDDCNGNRDDDYNRKSNIKDNKKITDNTVSVSSNEDEFINLFSKIGIEYKSNTRQVLESIIKEELSLEVLTEIINCNQATWQKQKSKSESYRFGTLKHIVSSTYQQTKNKLTSRKKQTEELIQEYATRPKIDYSSLAYANKQKREASCLDDYLDEVLDEIWW